MGTLADLVQGFQGGYTGVQDARRRRKLNQALDYELGGLEEKRQGRQAGRERLGYGDMVSGADFTMPKTYGERLVGKIKGMFGGSTGQQSTTAIDPGMQVAGPQQSGATTYGTEENRYAQPNRYKDGGAVRSMKRYANGGQVTPSQPGVMTPQSMGQYAIPSPNSMQQSASMGQAIPMADGGRANETPEEKRRRFDSMVERDENGDPVISGGGPYAITKDVLRNVGGNTRRRLAEWQPDSEATTQAFYDAEGAANKGLALRRDTAESARGIGQIGMGLLEDTGIAPLVKGIGGIFNYGTDEAKAANAGASGKAIDTEAAVTEAVSPPTASQPGQTPPNTQTPQAKNAAQPAGPDDEIVDFSSQAREISPQDMPNQSVKDWEDERMFWAAQAITMGNDPEAAMKAVDARQLRGFTQYAQQALMMLQNDDATGAARALYAAYQYFPNGSDVRFGVQKGKDGRPVLVGMGSKEDTGEPLGKPQVITVDSLATQIENFSNPAALRTWTKDWQDMEQQIREYNEVTVPAAQSQARYQDRAGKAALTNAQANYNDSVTGRQGGMKLTDKSRAETAFREAVEMEGFKNPTQADAMMDMMSQIWIENEGRVPENTVIRDVRDAIRAQNFDKLDQKYGR